MITVEITGKFNPSSMIAALHAESSKTAFALADATAQWLRSQIFGNRLGLVGSRGAWAKRKDGDTPLVNTQVYASGIKAKREGDHALIVPPDGYEQQAAWLEYGTTKFPARPHWRQASDEAKKLADRFVVDMMTRVGKAGGAR